MTGNESPEGSGVDAAGADAAAPATAGVILAQTREAAGLSVEDVALQLKLAPRQVAAIERDDFASLPGRTFVRGFVRNYARLLKLDVDAILAALPGEGAASALDRPSLAATTRAMGELPSERAARPGVGRWAIPLVLVAIVAIAVLYEFSRPPPPAPVAATPAVAPATQAPAPAPAAEPPSPASSATPSEAQPGGTQPAAPAGTATTALPNPMAAGSRPSGVVPQPTQTAATAAVPSATVAPAASSAPNQLSVRFRGTSWIEVRDRSGSVVLSMTGADGATREIAVAPPGEITVGNVAAVEASWRGRTIDLASQSKQNVARVRLD